MVTIDEVARIEIRCATILECEKVTDADKLLRLVCDLGPDDDSFDKDIVLMEELKVKYPGRHVRQIISAIAPFYPDPSVLVGKQIGIYSNLTPRMFRGYLSQGMIMATEDQEGGIVLLTPEKKVQEGSRVH
jgi:methionyl-tRNA synthetase